jgi:hypothetical protein
VPDSSPAAPANGNGVPTGAAPINQFPTTGHTLVGTLPSITIIAHRIIAVDGPLNPAATASAPKSTSSCRGGDQTERTHARTHAQQ